MSTFGPSYDPKKDAGRVHKQLDTIRDFMLNRNTYLSLSEIEQATRFPHASISAQLRHLRKPRFGAYVVDKRRRVGHDGTWEYRVFHPNDPTAPQPVDSSNGRIPVKKLRSLINNAIQYRSNPNVVKISLDAALDCLEP